MWCQIFKMIIISLLLILFIKIINIKFEIDENKQRDIKDIKKDMLEIKAKVLTYDYDSKYFNTVQREIEVFDRIADDSEIHKLKEEIEFIINTKEKNKWN